MSKHTLDVKGKLGDKSYLGEKRKGEESYNTKSSNETLKGMEESIANLRKTLSKLLDIVEFDEKAKLQINRYTESLKTLEKAMNHLRALQMFISDPRIKLDKSSSERHKDTVSSLQKMSRVLTVSLKEMSDSLHAPGSELPKIEVDKVDVTSKLMGEKVILKLFHTLGRNIIKIVVKMLEYEFGVNNQIVIEDEDFLGEWHLQKANENFLKSLQLYITDPISFLNIVEDLKFEYMFRKLLMSQKLLQFSSREDHNEPQLLSKSALVETYRVELETRLDALNTQEFAYELMEYTLEVFNDLFGNKEIMSEIKALVGSEEFEFSGDLDDFLNNSNNIKKLVAVLVRLSPMFKEFGFGNRDNTELSGLLESKDYESLSIFWEVFIQSMRKSLEGPSGLSEYKQSVLELLTKSLDNKANDEL